MKASPESSAPSFSLPVRLWSIIAAWQGTVPVVSKGRILRAIRGIVIRVFKFLLIHTQKTVGAMIEADIFCFGAFSCCNSRVCHSQSSTAGLAFSAFVCLGSMSFFRPLELSPGWEWLADVIVLSWIAAAMIFVAWSKVWMDKPSYNTACSMISIIIFIV